MNYYNYLLVIVFISKAYGMEQQKVQPGIYEHSRTKRRYEVVGTARSTENPRQKLIIYKQLYEGVLEPERTPLPFGSLWARPEEQFHAIVEISPGVTAPRFTKVPPQ